MINNLPGYPFSEFMCITLQGMIRTIVAMYFTTGNLMIKKVQ